MHPLLIRSVHLAAVIALAGTAIHFAAIVGGPSWFTFFGAPPVVVQSAKDGTMLAPVGSAIIGALMAVCALYAFSSVGVIPRLPLLKSGLVVIATICLLRAIALVPLAVIHPAVCNTFEIVSAIVWGIAGSGFAVGLKNQFQASRQRAKTEYASLIKRQLKHLNVVGGCCGTDHRHIEQITAVCLPLFKKPT